MVQKCRMVSVTMLDIYYNSTNTWVKVYTDASAKELGAILFPKHVATKQFYPIVYYTKKLTMCSKTTQLCIMKCWLSLKLSSIGDHTYMVRSLLYVWTIKPWNTSLHNQTSPFFSYDRLNIADFLPWCSI